MEIPGILVARVGAEGELDARCLRHTDEFQVGYAHIFGNLQGDVPGLRQVDDGTHTGFGPDFVVMAGKVDGQIGGPGKDVNRFVRQNVDDMLEVPLDKGAHILNEVVVPPDREPTAVVEWDSVGVH